MMPYDAIHHAKLLHAEQLIHLASLNALTGIKSLTHVYVIIYIYMYVYIYICIYIYTRNAWALRRRLLEVSHSQTNANIVATLNSYGKNT